MNGIMCNSKDELYNEMIKTIYEQLHDEYESLSKMCGDYSRDLRRKALHVYMEETRDRIKYLENLTLLSKDLLLKTFSDCYEEV